MYVNCTLCILFLPPVHGDWSWTNAHVSCRLVSFMPSMFSLTWVLCNKALFKAFLWLYHLLHSVTSCFFSMLIMASSDDNNPALTSSASSVEDFSQKVQAILIKLPDFILLTWKLGSSVLRHNLALVPSLRMKPSSCTWAALISETVRPGSLWSDVKTGEKFECLKEFLIKTYLLSHWEQADQFDQWPRWPYTFCPC